METAVCEQCGSRQPHDWKAGDLCTSCGGAVRAEQRCAGCARWTPRAKFCRSCGAELLPPELYGPARVLLAAGVDRFSLAPRVLALDPGQRDTLGAQYAAQAARAAWLVEEARFCERFLLQRGFADRLEEELIPALPAASPDVVGRIPPAGGLDLEELLEHSSLYPTRLLAALALLRGGKTDRKVLELAEQAGGSGDPHLELEAALALSSWRARNALHPGWRELRRRAEVASKALGDPRLRPWAAIAMAVPLWRHRTGALEEEERAAFDALRDPLRDALASSDPDLRFDAALALGDEEGLEAALGDVDEERRALARWRLAAVGARVIPRLLHDAGEEELREVLRGLDPPLPFATWEALLERAGCDGAGDSFRRDAFSLLRRSRFLEHSLEDRRLIGRVIANAAGRIGAPELLEFLTWATTPRGDEHGAWAELSPEAAPIHSAATAELARAPVKERRSILRDGSFDRWVTHAAPSDGAALEGWTEDANLAADVFEALLSAHARLNRYDEALRPRAMDLLLGIWDRNRRKAELAPAMAHALGHNGGITHSDAIATELWRRFRERPEERGVLMVAAEPWKSRLYELRDAEPVGASLDGGDPVAFFRLYAAVDPNARAVLSAAMEKRNGQERLLELVDAVFDLADAEAARRPFDMMLVVAPLASEVSNAYRGSGSTQQHAVAARRLQERWATFAKALDAIGYGPASQPSPRHLFEQVEVELRIIAEEQERSRPPPPPPLPPPELEPEPEPEMPPEPQVAAEPTSAPASPPAPPPPARVRLVPGIELLAVDREALVAPPIATLLDYVELLKQMSGGNPLEVFAQAGLDITAWTRTCNEWGTVLQKRPDAAMRFAALLQASWTPRAP